MTRIERAIALLGPQTGLVVTTDSFLTVHRGTIIPLVIRDRVPTIFDGPRNCREGGLICYEPNYPSLFKSAAIYIDRVLRGTKPSDLPVQVPIKFDLVINNSTARALGLTIPQTLLATADEVIE